VRALRERVAAEPLGGIGVGGTTLLHAAVLLLFLAGRGGSTHRPLPMAYRVELIAGSAAPAAASETAPATPAVPAPVRVSAPRAPAAPPRPRETAPVRRAPPAPATPPRPANTPATATPQTAPPAPGVRPAAGAAPVGAAAPAAAPGTGSDVATVRTEGVEFPFPGYLRNLVAQVYRRWHPPGGNAGLEAEVFFFVRRDGTVTGLQFVRRSGSFAFDLEAQGALEAAARAGAFGGLPPGYGADVLPVSFFFSPQALR
jgi:outer membrane biosynthesis protein TonB